MQLPLAPGQKTAWCQKPDTQLHHPIQVRGQPLVLQWRRALGFMYYRGKGAPKNEQEAANWFSKAAELGHVNAQNNLGRM